MPIFIVKKDIKVGLLGAEEQARRLLVNEASPTRQSVQLMASPWLIHQKQWLVPRVVARLWAGEFRANSSASSSSDTSATNPGGNPGTDID